VSENAVEHMENQLPMDNQGFIQHGAASHSGKIMVDILHTVFNSSAI
jgi:hypothetical protein